MPTHAGFNSKLVQLEVGKIRNEIIEKIPSFNSKLVRLEDSVSVTRLKRLIVFQFQTGSIRSELAFSITGVNINVSIPNWFD